MEDILFLCTGHFKYVFHEHFFQPEILLCYIMFIYVHYVMYCHPYIKYAIKEGPVLQVCFKFVLKGY